MRRIQSLAFDLDPDYPASMGPDHMARIDRSRARMMAGMYPMPRPGHELVVGYTKFDGVISRLMLSNILGDWYLASDTTRVEHWPQVFLVEIIPPKPEPLRCPECGEKVHDIPVGSALPKCWNSEGHKSGAPLAFDTMPD